jgi:CheY-like chemotaxis protein
MLLFGVSSEVRRRQAMPSTLPVTIVIVEDDLGHARLIERSLQKAHIANDIVILRDGQEALAYLFPEPFIEEPPNVPYLILLDLSLPLVDGYTVLERVKRDEQTQHVPVIVLTTMDVPAEIERCYALGCNVYITKPVEETRFIEAIRQLGLFVSIVQLPTGLLPVTPHCIRS